MSGTVSVYSLNGKGAIGPGGYIERPYASREEILEFANKVRLAGGADPLEDLLPSQPREAQVCLIANALNFNSVVMGLSYSSTYGDFAYDDEGVRQWAMYLPLNMSEKDAKRIGEAVDCEVVFAYNEWDDADTWALILPGNIRNAAIAFDNDIDFQDLNTLKSD